MDIALIIGVVLGMSAMIGSIAYALFVEGSAGGFGDFISIPSFGIVAGGMIASIFVAFPMPHVVALGKAIGAVLKPADDKMGPLVDTACEVGESARKGAADLEKAVETIRIYFLKDGIQMVVDGYSLDEVTDIMETRIEYREKREKVQTDMLKAMGDLAPAWGMVGTLIGLVLMLAGFGGEGGADNLGGGMAAALITTLYGAVFANLFFLPMAQKMGNKTTMTSMSASLLVEASRLIHQKKHPLIIREKLNSFIPPSEWKRE
ncbi:MAG TPA: motility protein A [Candidatus Marinimicrobia bacterium]|jgi:chemotaxis protein MotA|nr:motility protein A [Candidatus Neomarinimicrobiota bacterium]